MVSSQVSAFKDKKSEVKLKYETSKIMFFTQVHDIYEFHTYYAKE